ncbi:phosphoribulokinase [Aciditerrimonas ferrireducens]|uniref:phosphoribulokinase n=1 Tax=Aciditerrimonas ferrireducens TaxID=667306 RepID=A0ABV6BZS8_9ACTN
MPHKQALLRRLTRPAGHRPVMLAIAGDSAAGKSTLTRGLAEAIGSERVAWMCVDDYHRYDREERRGLPFTPLHPACNYMEVMEQHLQLLAMGEPILKPVYDHHTGKLVRPELFVPAEHVIVEGLLPLASPLSRACFDLTVYLDPPEELRRAWKVRRDTRDRGYRDEEVLAELARREADAASFIRPQRQYADIVVRFAPIEGRPVSEGLSTTVLLRPTAPHPDLSTVLTEDTREAIHLKLVRDLDGKPVDALHVHAYASPEKSAAVKAAIWGALGVDREPPPSLGLVEPGVRSEPLAIVQLLILYHLVLARRTHDGSGESAPPAEPPTGEPAANAASVASAVAR